jgi:hypothetical protein
MKGKVIEFPKHFFKQYYIEIIHKSIGAGGSKPVLVKGSDGNEYVLKTKHDSYTFMNSIFCELLTYSVALELEMDNIFPGKPVLLIIDELTIEQAKIAYSKGLIAEQSYKNISLSKGTNIGIPFLKNAQPSNVISNKTFGKQTALLDSYMINNDRMPLNPNILYDALQKKYYAIDFGYSFYWHMLLNQIHDGTYNDFISEDNDLYKGPDDACCIYVDKYRHANLLAAHCTKSFQAEVSIPAAHKDISEATIRKLLSIFPADWNDYISEIEDVIADTLSTRIGNKSVLR